MKFCKIKCLSLVFIFLTACSTTRMPGVGVERMSNDTLCYRAAYASGDPAINAEIKSRHLDCEKMARQQDALHSDF
jgi:hypothetical protein